MRFSVRLVYKFKITDNQEIRNLCRISKNLYNQALYIVKQHYKKSGNILWYTDLDKIMKKEVNLESEINYRLLKAQVSQQILKLLDTNLRSFFKSIKDWKRNKSKYRGRPRFPRYLKQKEYLLIYTNQSARIKNGKIYLAKNLTIDIPEYKGKDFTKFNQIRILPRKDCLEVEIVYEQEIENKDLDYNSYASIDLGVNNIITMITTKNKNPVIISGGIPKSINQWYNKERAKLCSVKDKMKIKGYTKRLKQITSRRNNRIKDYFHKTSRLIVNYLVKNKIGVLVVGQTSDWKTQSRIGRVNNQNFQLLPLQELVGQLEYKCKLVGIKLIKVNEAYTSKCDGLAFEKIGKHKSYLGKRVNRGLFQSSVGKLINADVNSCINILRRAKVVCDSTIKWITDRGFWFNPVKIRSLFETNSLQIILC